MNFLRTLVLWLILPLLSTEVMAQRNWALVVHGGAGTILKKNMSPEKEKAYTDKLNEVLKKGEEVLSNGGTALEAVETCIMLMEDSPLFNAGKGSVFTHDGKNEMDASIMDGKTLNAGAVAGVNVIKHPISAARVVMSNSPHVMMVGDGAEQFAESQGIELVDPSYFYTEKRHKQLQRIKQSEDKDQQQLDHSGDQDDSKGMHLNDSDDKKFGTVGIVALDVHGNLAAGTSTGGMTNKKWGRVGDSPIIGAGTYANNKTCAVSSTGHGEYFIKAAVAYDISALMEYKGMSVQEAAEEVVMKKLVEMGGEGGVIALDAKGNFAMTFNSAGMYRGYITSEGKSEVLIYK